MRSSIFLEVGGLGKAVVENLVDGVGAGFLPGQPGGGGKRAAGKDAAVGGAMGQLQAFAVGSDHGGMFADDVAAADHGETDAAFVADARVSVAPMHGQGF